MCFLSGEIKQLLFKIYKEKACVVNRYRKTKTKLKDELTKSLLVYSIYLFIY